MMRPGNWRALLAAGVAAAAAVDGAWAQQSWQELVRAAETEGKVVVIGPPIAPHRETIQQFQKAFPKIALEYSGMTASESEPRLRAERKAGVYNWDVIVSGVSATLYTAQIPAGWLAPIRDVIRPENARDELWIGGYDASFLDKERKRVFATQATVSHMILVHRGLIPRGEIKDMSDLLDPKWKGKIALYDPRLRGPGITPLIQFMLAVGEDNARKFLREQDVVVTTTTRQLAEWAMRGRYPITFGLAEGERHPYQVQGIGKEVEPLPLPPRLQSVSPQWGAVVLVSNQPHPAASAVFINWLLSRDAQADWAKRAQVNSRRTDVPPGDPGSLIDAATWINGLKLNSEASVPVALQGLRLATEGLK
jgi:iron(III) transport system substrate-binding protein